MLASIKWLDALTGRWAELPDMPPASHGLAAVVSRRAIITMGGYTDASNPVGTASRQCWRCKPRACPC